MLCSLYFDLVYMEINKWRCFWSYLSYIFFFFFSFFLFFLTEVFFILSDIGLSDWTIFLYPCVHSTPTSITERRCPWCNGYRRRKWTRRLEFKSWTRLIAFHIALIPLGKVWIQLFSHQLWVNSRTDRFFSLGEANSLEEGKLWIEIC